METPRKLFLPDGRFILGSELQYLNHGKNASVWKWSSKDGSFAVKTFYPDCYRWAIDSKVADLFMNLDFHNLPNLYSTFRSDEKALKKTFDGYIMEYFEEDAVASLLDLPSNNFYWSIYNLEQDIDLISSHNVVLADVKFENSMITMDQMFHLLDYDLFRIDSSKSKDTVHSYNNHEICSFVYLSLIEELYDELDFSDDEKNRIQYFLKKQFSSSSFFFEEQSQLSEIKSSDIVGNLFCDDTTPKNSLKKKVDSLRYF